MKYGQKVRVTSWFYEWMEGIAIREKFLWLNAMAINWKLVADLEIIVKLEIEWDIHEVAFPESNLEIIN